jgi:hypothetical protein
MRKEITVALQNTQPGFGSRAASARTSSIVSALVGLTLGYVVATVANPVVALPTARTEPAAQLPGLSAGAESIDNSRECNPAEGITTACVY